MTVDANQLGAHMLFDWNNNNNIDVAVVWNKDSTFPPPNFMGGYNFDNNTSSTVFMLSSMDDYPLHQIAEPIRFAGTSDRNFYDRYFFNGYARDGATYFAAALGCYPSRQVMDAAGSVAHRGRQYVLRSSRLACPERLETRVGPVSVDVQVPLERLRLCIEHAWPRVPPTMHALSLQGAILSNGRMACGSIPARRTSNGGTLIAPWTMVANWQ